MKLVVRCGPGLTDCTYSRLQQYDTGMKRTIVQVVVAVGSALNFQTFGGQT
jgi:hypothetical protein